MWYPQIYVGTVTTMVLGYRHPSGQLTRVSSRRAHTFECVERVNLCGVLSMMMLDFAQSTYISVITHGLKDHMCIYIYICVSYIYIYTCTVYRYEMSLALGRPFNDLKGVNFYDSVLAGAKGFFCVSPIGLVWISHRMP